MRDENTVLPEHRGVTGGPSTDRASLRCACSAASRLSRITDTFVVTEYVKHRSDVNEIGSSMPVVITPIISLPIRIVTCLLARFHGGAARGDAERPRGRPIGYSLCCTEAFYVINH